MDTTPLRPNVTPATPKGTGAHARSVYPALRSQLEKQLHNTEQPKTDQPRFRDIFPFLLAVIIAGLVLAALLAYATANSGEPESGKQSDIRRLELRLKRLEARPPVILVKSNHLAMPFNPSLKPLPEVKR